MSITGLCHVCERAAATASCDRCGAVVCPDHYVRERGICVDCVDEPS